MQKQFGRNSRDDETERGERPNQAYIALGEQVKQATKKNRLEENARQNVAVGGAASHDPTNLGRGDLLQFPDLFQSGAQEDHPHRFEHKTGDQDQEHSGHIINPGSELI